METVRLGVVGSGGMAARRMAAFSSLEGCKLAGLAARNPETGPALAARYGVPLLTDWEHLVARQDIDAIVVMTHNDSHGPIALAAMEAGKHVFAEYPLARRLEEGERLVELAERSGRVLRLTHEQSISAEHQRIRQEVGALGRLLTAVFIRMTPGRGRRPEILFNLNVSGPPALFFIYHIYPLVDLFGPAAWVQAHSDYVGLDETSRYQRFLNTVTVEFARGGIGQWTWAGGIATEKAEEFQRLVLTDGTLIREGGTWHRSAPEGREALPVTGGNGRSLEETFLREIRGQESLWKDDLQTAFQALRISLAAERSANEHRRIDLS